MSQLRHVHPVQELAVLGDDWLIEIKMRLLMFSFLCFMLFGCSDKFDKNKLVGTYALNSDVSDVLELELTGNYHHRFKDSAGSEIVATDTWELETVEGSPTVTLHNFRSTVEGVNALGQGYFLLKVTSSGHKSRLWVGVDKTIFYEQTGP
jgi:hypothetical protein